MTTKDTKTQMIPDAAWFRSLPEDRKTKAIQGAYLWRLSEDKEMLWGKLSRHADHGPNLTVNREYAGVDPLVVEMLDRVPDMLMQGFTLFATSAVLVSLDEMVKAIKRSAPQDTVEMLDQLTRETKSREDYLGIPLKQTRKVGVDHEGKDMMRTAYRMRTPQDDIDRHVMFSAGNRRRLWASMDATPDGVEKAWRIHARADFMLQEIAKATAGDY